MSKRFDDYNVECNDCAHYWDDSCSGTQVGTTKACRDYKATRTVDIPKQIKQLEKHVDNLENCKIIIIICFGILAVLQVANVLY